MTSRLEILSEIDKLEDNHCASCTLITSKDSNKYCAENCDIGKELQCLGNQLLQPKRDRINQLLEKGQNLTSSEILYLVNQEIPKSEIAKAVGMWSRFAKYLEKIEKEPTAI